MGIPGLRSAFYRAYGPKEVFTDGERRRRGQTFTPVAVDTWNVMFRMLRRLDKDMIVSRRELNFVAVLALVNNLLKHSLLPVFVYDGYGKKRKGDGEAREAAADVFGPSTFSPPPPPRSRSRSPSPPPSTVCPPVAPPMYAFCKRVLFRLGFPFVEVAETEADVLCAGLYHSGLVAFVVSNDSDMMLLGCDVMVGVGSNSPYVMYADKLRARTRATRSDMMDAFLKHNAAEGGPPRPFPDFHYSVIPGEVPSRAVLLEMFGEFYVRTAARLVDVLWRKLARFAFHSLYGPPSAPEPPPRRRGAEDEREVNKGR